MSLLRKEEAQRADTCKRSLQHEGCNEDDADQKNTQVPVKGNDREQKIGSGAYGLLGLH